MISYPLHYRIAQPGRCSRLQLLLRVLAFVALGVLGLSFGTVFLFGFIALPVFAASRLSVKPPAAYLADDGSRILRLLRWFAAVSAWAGLVAETLPGKAPEDTVLLDLDADAHPTPPTPASAAWRVLTGIPSALVLALLGCIGCLVWLWAALSILFNQRIGADAFNYLAGLQRWSVRLLAYQASLVERYPPFSFDDSPPPALPTANAATRT